MTLISILLFVVPFIAFCIFTFLSNRKLPQEYNAKLVRRIYYLFIILYLFLLLIVFREAISSLSIIRISNVDKVLLNNIVVIIVLLLIAIIWEYLFISCKTLKNVKFKDVELSFDEQNKIEYTDKLQEKEIKSLDSVINTKINMVKYIDKYAANNELDPAESYEDILKEYGNQRKNIKTCVYFENNTNISLMQKKLRLKNDELSSIMYAINLFGYCKPKNLKNLDYIFARIKTKYTEDNIIVVLVSDLLVDNENLILLDIVNYFEMIVTINILEMEKIHTELVYNPAL